MIAKFLERIPGKLKKYINQLWLELRNLCFLLKGAPDDLPIPSKQLVFLVTYGYDQRAYYDNGVLGSQCIKRILNKNGLNIEKFNNIFDFGVGCGRILRQWSNLRGPKFYGSDYNSDLINWCKSAFIFAEINLNKSDSQLVYESDKFDFIYAISIFTHLNEEMQFYWIKELRRVLEPGGFLLITVHGTTRLHLMMPQELKKYKTDGFVVREPGLSGTNHCCAFHADFFVRRKLAKGFEVIDFVPGGAEDANQDQILLRKSK